MKAIIFIKTWFPILCNVLLNGQTDIYFFPTVVLQKYLDNFDLSIKIVYMLGTLGFAVGTAVMAIFPNVYVAMVMISTMGVFSMSISYCPYALLGQYHESKEVGIRLKNII